MKSIEPISIWKDGEQHQANQLSVVSIYDDLLSSATFYYKLSEAPVEEVDGEGNVKTLSAGGVLADGNVDISGEDYENWGNDEDINLGAYQFVAGKLGLTLV